VAQPSLIAPGVGAVFFDAVGTLIHPQPAAADVYAAVGRRFGSQLELAVVAARFRAAFRRQEERDHAGGLRTDETREVARWRAIVGEVLDDVADPEGCFQALYTHFARAEAWRCDLEAEATLRALAARGYCLGVASNFDQRLHGIVAALPALRPVRCVVISSEVGWRKPAPAFFEEMCRQAGLPAAQVLLVGDDVVNDYEGARTAGLPALLLDPRGKEPIQGNARLTRLGELIASEPTKALHEKRGATEN
jgi:putative hydrolase of the HAD superfamily